MRRVAVILLLAGCASSSGTSGGSASGPEQQAWAEFVRVMESGPYPTQDIRPYDEILREPMAGFLEQMRAKANWREWHKTPRVVLVEDQAHFILPLTFDGQVARYSFSFIKEGSTGTFSTLRRSRCPLTNSVSYL